MKNKKSILVIAAHPDDETLGCGGTMARHAKEGDTVHLLILAEGVTSREGYQSPEKREKHLFQLQKNAKRAAHLLGVKSVSFGGFPDNRMDSVDLLDIVKVIEKQLQRTKASVVYTHHAGDVNIDHNRCHEAVLAAIRPYPGQLVKETYFFEVPSSTEWRLGGKSLFTPTRFNSIEKFIHLKKSALQCYVSEIRPWPHPRSVRGIEVLAQWRGSTVGFNYAECFEVGRFVRSAQENL